MFEMDEYLKNLYDALKDKDTDRLQEIGGFYENDDQYDYETHDLREINLSVAYKRPTQLSTASWRKNRNLFPTRISRSRNTSIKK